MSRPAERRTWKGKDEHRGDTRRSDDGGVQLAAHTRAQPSAVCRGDKRTLSNTTVVLVICIKGRETGERKVCTTSGASSATWIRNTADLA